MSIRQNIVASAVVGTEQQQFTPPSIQGDIGRMLSGLDFSDREGALLKSSAFVSLYYLSGFIPATGVESPVDKAENDELQSLTAESRNHLSLMLSGEYKEVLPEWLAAICRAKRRVSSEFLPAILAKGESTRDLRSLISETIGKRGHWLARQNDKWRWAVAPDEVENWEVGDRVVRLATLKTLRVTNPVRALELLKSTWKSENAKDRQAFLEAIDKGLSGADESFLSEALEDRSVEVRRTATELLLNLRGSQVSRIATERISSLLTYKKPFLGKARLEITLPGNLDEWKKETRIDAAPQSSLGGGKPMGEKAWWLLHAFGAIDPSWWCRAFGRKPAELLDAAHDSEWKESLTTGFVIAAGRFADQDWIEALLSDRQIRPAHALILNQNFLKLPRCLDANRLEALLLKEFSNGKKGLRLDPHTISILQQHQRPWGEELSRAVVVGINEQIKVVESTNVLHWQLKSALRQFSLYALPSVSYELIAEIAIDNESPWRTPIDEFQSYIGFRRDMMRAIG